jgi:hypothetical protein
MLSFGGIFTYILLKKFMSSNVCDVLWNLFKMSKKFMLNLEPLVWKSKTLPIT